MDIKMRLFSHNIWNFDTYNRNALIAKLIRKYDVDICHFQECGPSTSRKGETAIQILLSPEYTEACTEVAFKNYTPVFYKKDRFLEIDSGYVLFEGKNDADSKSVTWVVLEEKNSGKRVALASTHFWWMAESEEDDIQRVENARCIKKVSDMIKEKYNLALLVSGDLNCGPNSEQGSHGYDELVKLGFSDIRNIAKETTDMLTHHEYPILNEDGIFEKGAMPVRTLDHAFIAQGHDFSFPKFDVLTEQDALDSSDHCPLLVDFEF